MSPRRDTHFGRNVRDQAGCTITFENAAGELLSGHRTGKPLTAFNELCDAALALDPSYRVVCYSTPETILRDLRGRQVKDMRTAERGNMMTVEQTTCGMAKRREMLHPRLRGSTRSADALYNGSD